jgi:hypothetical protein
MVLIIAQSIGSTLASAAAGILLCWSLWLVFRLVRHPHWGPPLILVPFACALAGLLPDSEFLRRTLIFAVASVGPFWVAGLIWRANRREYPNIPAGPADSTPVAGPPLHYPRYPAIAACICENRRPSRGELKKVMVRIWREAFAARYPSPGFAERRRVVRAARAALEGSQSRG